MALFGWTRGPRLRAEDHDSAVPRPRDPADDFWFGGAMRRTHSGEVVTIERARRVPVVRNAIQVLTDPISTLAFGVFGRETNDDRVPLRGHPVAQLLSRPNRRETGAQFLRQMADDLCTAGEFLAERVAPMTRQEELYRIAPCDFVVEELPDRGLRFRIRERGRAERVLLDDEVWFIAVPPFRDRVRGTSPILHDGAEAIGAALALQAYANGFWANDATPPFVFKHAGSFADPASKRSFLDAWARWFGGRNRGRPGVLEYGMDIQQLAHTHEQAQFLETRKELWLDIARLWRVPPHKVGILDKATFSNIEHQSLEFVTDTLAPWLELIEQSVGRTFLAGREGEYFEFNVASLLRGDIKTRFEAYAIARQWGFVSVNEIRRRENLNGIGPAGDRFIEPLNMVPVGSAPGEDRGAEDRRATANAIAYLRQSVARNGGRPNLKVIDHAA
jgi:HK97 family phage portal protein